MLVLEMRSLTNEIPEALTDYEMKTYFNPYYHQIRMEELHSDKEDLYYKSCSWTEYGDVFGVTRRSIPVENLGEKLVSLDDHIKHLERKYRKRKHMLDTVTKGWHMADMKLLDRYFRKQMAGYTIESPVLDYLKVELYERESTDRDDRTKARWQKEREAILNKAHLMTKQDELELHFL